MREAFPSRTTGTDCAGGNLTTGHALTLISEMNDDGVIFCDGIEHDRLNFAPPSSR